MQHTRDELTQSGAVVLWSWPRRDSRYVEVRYPCCGAVLTRAIFSLSRFRTRPTVRCETCVRTPKPFDVTKPPLCPCGRHPRAKNYRRGRITGFKRVCWSCSVRYTTRREFDAARAWRRAMREQQGKE